MTGYVVFGDVSTAADNANIYNLALDDSILVATKATLATNGVASAPINFTSSGQATIAGLVYSAQANAISAAGGLEIEVTGQVLARKTAIRMGGYGVVSVSRGATVASSVDYGIYGASPTAPVSVVNDGDVSGYYAVYLSGPSANVVNSGSLYSHEYGLIMINSNSRLENSGEIVAEGISVQIGSGGAYVENSGIISGAYGITVTPTGIGAANYYFNSGQITGLGWAILTASEADRFLNSGTILGSVSLGGGADYMDTTTGVLRGTVDMGDGDDTFLGSAFGDVVLGGLGNDTLKGFGGDDVLTGGPGGDVLSGGEGRDTFVYLGVSDAAPAAPDLITDFETGVDKIDISAIGAGGAVAINLGLGNSTVYFQTASGAGGQGVISLYGTIGANDIIVGAGTTFFITGTRLADTIVGTSGVDYITGGGGADVLTGGAGADVFVYGSVADSPSGANDVILDFETGSDKLDFTALGAGSAIAINMGPWSTVYYQTATSGSQGVIGISGIVRGADLNVSAGATVYITGTAGADVIYGSNVTDYINGGAGDDNIAGGLGADVLTGGAGSDAFYFFSTLDSPTAAPDRITDFDPSQDFIDLSNLDANTGLAGQQHFSLVAGFTATAGQLVSYVSGGFIHFDGDVNGDGVADFAILVTPNAYWDPYADPSHLRL